MGKYDDYDDTTIYNNEINGASGRQLEMYVFLEDK